MRSKKESERKRKNEMGIPRIEKREGVKEGEKRKRKRDRERKQRDTRESKNVVKNQVQLSRLQMDVHLVLAELLGAVEHDGSALGSVSEPSQGKDTLVDFLEYMNMKALLVSRGESVLRWLTVEPGASED